VSRCHLDRPRSNTAVEPFVPSGRPQEKTCLLASRSGTLAAVTTTARLPKLSTAVWRFGPAGACCFVKPDPLMHHFPRTTMTFAPRYNGFKPETILPYFEPARVRVNPTKCPFHPKI